MEDVLVKEVLWYWFCNIVGIGHKKQTELLAYFSTIDKVFLASAEELHQINVLSENDIAHIIESRDYNAISKEYEGIVKRGYSFLSIEDERYPKRLKTLYDPCYGIYVNGKLPKEDVLSIGIVGARNCSQYGKEVAKYFAYHLAEAGVQIISGMARGVDGFSHEGALTAGGYTLAVLGSGVDYCYPRENMHIYMSLEKKGGIMSELPMGTLPRAGNFPRRNRLISGMCDGLLVVEAKLKSGSLITVDQALEQGRDVFVIPGRITDVLSSGTNNLIKMGAELVTTPQEILDYYANKYESIERNSEINGVLGENPLIEAKLSEEQQCVYRELSIEPKNIEELAEKTKLSIPKLMSNLVILELKGYIVQPVTNYYSKSI